MECLTKKNLQGNLNQIIKLVNLIYNHNNFNKLFLIVMVQEH